MKARTTTNRFETDDDGLARVLVPREDIVAEEALPADGPGLDGTHRFGCAEGPFDEYERTVQATALGDGRHEVHEEVRWALAIPIWDVLFRPLAARQIRRDVAPPPEDPDAPEKPPPWWSPPARLDARATRILSLLCGLSMLTGYLGTTITQTITYAADEFGASKGAQGVALAAVRAGVLGSLVLMAISDRKGRHRLLGLCAVAGILCSVAGALSPGMAALAITQTGARAFATALALLLGVVAAEEMPAGARAYAASVLAMTAALGAGVAVMLLPLTEAIATAIEPGALWWWRLIYAFPLLLVGFFLRVARALPETKRFLRPHGRVHMRGHRGRLLLLSVAGFFGLLFLAPVSQFQNEFLRDEHGFGAAQIALFAILTNTPGGVGIVVGGKLADLHGRRIVGAVGTVAGAFLLALGYWVSGLALWLTWMVGTILGAATIPALGVYGPELFPTALRGRANGIITLTGVIGSSTGLIVAGRLATRWDSFGPAMSLLAIGPCIGALLVLTLYPETARRELEDINPEDAIGAAIAPPMR
ncbi:MAG: MFS transporter [Acidimicrobiales bacterium]